MLRHPFHGIVGPESKLVPEIEQAVTRITPAPGQLARRGFFAHSLAALAGAGAWLFTRSAPAQDPFDTHSRGMGFPEGGALQGGFGGGIRFPSRDSVTTQAVGEEGGGGVTTQAVGEEGGRVTTFALGEEGGRVTTYAVGEEGGYYPPRRRRGRVTTQALDEEGGIFNRR